MNVQTVLMALVALAASAGTAYSQVAWPLREWTKGQPAQVGLDESQLHKARDYALTGGGSGYITRHGKLVLAWGDATKRYDLKSTTKSFGATALGVAIQDDKLRLSDPAIRYHPSLGVPPQSNADLPWREKITILHLATHTAGFEKPGGYTKLTFEPGTQWAYSDGGPNWLAECLTLLYKQDLQELMFERVFTPLGIGREDLTWRNNQYRDHNLGGIPRREFGAGIHANVDAMARVGYLYLREGEWNGKRILPTEFVKQAGTRVESLVGLPVVNPEDYSNASDHYGLLWWNNADGALEGVPHDAFWSWGLHDSLIVVIPSLDLVVARAGQSWKREQNAGHYDVLGPFLAPICAAVQDQPLKLAKLPYPQSSVIPGIEWAAPDSITRAARGGDNWPMTWGDDDAQYTAYGDGRGFEPFIETKLSLGLARIEGPADRFNAFNLRSTSAEQKGDGAKGKKASGMLMVDGVLYMLVRNAGNSQLAWSKDRGRSWQWSDWKCERSFGCPTFLNFGRNYAGARDEYVYVYSHDHDSAYKAADRMVLARVPKNAVVRREKYEFLAGFDAQKQPHWTSDVKQRAPVFEHPGRCYRSGISYNAALKRYLWCQILPGDDPRFRGGLGIYDAPEPWGPWTTVFFTEQWDVGPGETASLPAKWMSDDGRTVHLVFSGDDHFSVRRATLKVRD